MCMSATHLHNMRAVSWLDGQWVLCTLKLPSIEILTLFNSCCQIGLQTFWYVFHALSEVKSVVKHVFYVEIKARDKPSAKNN